MWTRHDDDPTALDQHQLDVEEGGWDVVEIGNQALANYVWMDARAYFEYSKS